MSESSKFTERKRVLPKEKQTPKHISSTDVAKQSAVELIRKERLAALTEIQLSTENLIAEAKRTAIEEVSEAFMAEMEYEFQKENNRLLERYRTHVTLPMHVFVVMLITLGICIFGLVFTTVSMNRAQTPTVTIDTNL